MSNAQLETAIEAAWEARDEITPATTGETREAIEDTLNALDGGGLRVAERRKNGDWHVNQWAKKAVLLGFRIKDMEQQHGGHARQPCDAARGNRRGFRLAGVGWKHSDRGRIRLASSRRDPMRLARTREIS